MRKRGGFSPLFIVTPKPPLLAVVSVSCHFCHLG
ncbi:rfbP protein [Vibrio cholerae]|nr:rfbP protein [Vibrio cholerae]NAO57859.1 rfbP protein [Vibrio cholerae]PUA72274.1 rfbP protein [Vibrio cholerae]